MQTLAVDFDGVIHKDDQKVEGAREALEYLYKRYKIIIHSARGHLPEVKQWLDENSIAYHDITNIKPNAILYIDDKGLRFTNWKDVLAFIDTI